MTEIERLIARFSLKPHPEGGFFAESYRAKESIPRSALPSRFKGDRAFSTAIYFLLPKGTRSKLHRIQADELWHFYAGGPLIVTEKSPDGAVKRTTLGPRVEEGHVFQHAVPAGTWFGAEPAPGTEYALVGCTVAPGFDFADFELGEP